MDSDTLSYEEIENLIAVISSGKEYIYFKELQEFIVIHFPDNDIKLRADKIYESAYQEALKDGLLPKKELESLLYDRGIFTKEKDLALSKLQDKLKAQRVLLSKTLKVRANQERIKKTINKLENEILIAQAAKQEKLNLSAEAKAEEAKQYYLCWLCTRKISGELYWVDYKDFVNADKAIKDLVFKAFIKLFQGISTKTIRYLARSTLWRIRYVSSLKSSDALFGRPSTEYTTDQINLIYWSNFYENIYSMLPEHKPSDDIIEDDELLDRFMEDYYKEVNNEVAISRSNKARGRGSMSAFDAEEVIITQSHELYQDIEYDKPREAQQIKNRVDIKKRTVSKRK